MCDGACMSCPSRAVMEPRLRRWTLAAWKRLSRQLTQIVSKTSTPVPHDTSASAMWDGGKCRLRLEATLAGETCHRLRGLSGALERLMAAACLSKIERPPSSVIWARTRCCNWPASASSWQCRVALTRGA